MTMDRRSFWASIILLAIFLASPQWVQAGDALPAVQATTVVTVLGTHDSASPPLTRHDIAVYSSKDRLNITSWVPARGPNGQLQLAIVIDNSDGTLAVGYELDAIAAFINAQPPSTQVGLFYADAESFDTAAKFSADHQAVANALRLPVGWKTADSPSVYLSLADLVKHWPDTGAPRREVLLICAGIDHLYPGVESPDVAAAIGEAEKAGVVVYTLYSGGDRFGLSDAGAIAQQNLVQLSGATGGSVLYNGLVMPVAFGPFLEQLNRALGSQYLLTFTIPRSKKAGGEIRPIRLRCEQRDVKLSYPREVSVPGRALRLSP